MDEYFYYFAFFPITILVLWGAFLTIVTVVQTILVRRTRTKPDGVYLHLATQFLNGLVTLVVALWLFGALWSEAFSTWILLILAIGFSLIESALFRYQQRRLSELWPRDK